MSRYIKLTKQEKNELRRLTQKANRQVKQYHKAMKREGLEIAPYQPTGGIQTKAQWETEKNPLSRSTKFVDKSEFKKRMRFLRSFDNEIERPKYTEYSIAQKNKLKKAMETSIGDNLSSDMNDKIDSLGLGQVNKFWDKFEEVSRRLGMNYSSQQAMSMTLEFFNEDKEGLLSKLDKEGK